MKSYSPVETEKTPVGEGEEESQSLLAGKSPLKDVKNIQFKSSNLSSSLRVQTSNHPKQLKNNRVIDKENLSPRIQSSNVNVVGPQDEGSSLVDTYELALNLT